MANKYNFSVERMNRITHTVEKFGVEGMGSFDEARNEVQKGVHDQELREQAYFEANPQNTGLASSLARPGTIHPHGPATAGAVTPNGQQKAPISGNVSKPAGSTSAK